MSGIARIARTVAGNVQVAMREGDPSAEILAYGRSHGVDLIVMGTHGRRGLDRIIGGSVTERVARDGGVSVLAAREPSPAERVSPPRLSKIVCAVDLSESSDDTVETAAMLAQATGARLTVLYAIELWHWEEPWAIARGDEDECIRRLSDEGHRRLAEFLGRHRHAGLVIEPLVVVGHPRQDILNAAEQEHPDVLIIGAHRLSRLNRVLFGSTARHVLRAARCPVLIARPGARSSTATVGSSEVAAAPAR
jgi:nucleotide-binding universal stress UspA family protein